MRFRNPSNGDTLGGTKIPKPSDFNSDDIDSNCSTPYVSAPSSPGRNPIGYFFSAPASPVHYVLSSSTFSSLAAGAIPAKSSELLVSDGSFEFDGANSNGSMISADELFVNGQIRPMKLSSRLHRPQRLSPLLDLNEDYEEETRGREIRFRSGSVHRRARSMSPMRNSRFLEDDDEEEEKKDLEADPDPDLDPKEIPPSDSSASTSRSSSTGRNSKSWIFLKDLLYRSKSEGRSKEKFWHSKSRDSKPPLIPISSKKPPNGVNKRRGPLPSAHERHYTANRAQAEEMRKRTFLPYRQGLLGCLGFSSRSYGAVNGFAKTLNPVS